MFKRMPKTRTNTRTNTRTTGKITGKAIDKTTHKLKISKNSGCQEPLLSRFSSDGMCDNISESLGSVFSRRIDEILVMHGHYSITQKGYHELSRGGKLQLYVEGREQLLVKRITRSVKDDVQKVIDGKISEGSVDYLLENGWIKTISKGKWSDLAVRVDVIHSFAKFVEKPITRVGKKDVKQFGLRGLFSSYYKDSYYSAFLEAGLVYSNDEIQEHYKSGVFKTSKVYPWEFTSTPHNFFADVNMRRAAIHWLVWKYGGDPLNLTSPIIKKELAVLHSVYSTIYALLLEGNFVYSFEEAFGCANAGKFKKNKLYPWELNISPQGLFEDLSMRIAAVKWLLWKSKKKVNELIELDFIEHGLNSLSAYYGNSLYQILVETGFAYSIEEIGEFSKTWKFKSEKIYPWELKVSPMDFFNDKNMRIAAIRWLVKVKGINPKRLTSVDLTSFGLRSLHNTSTMSNTDNISRTLYSLFLEAEICYTNSEVYEHLDVGVFKTDKIYPWEMEVVPRALFENEKFFVAAIDWLIWRSGKNLTELHRLDFDMFHLLGVINTSKGSIQKAITFYGRYKKLIPNPKPF